MPSPGASESSPATPGRWARMVSVLLSTSMSTLSASGFTPGSGTRATRLSFVSQRSIGRGRVPRVVCPPRGLMMLCSSSRSIASRRLIASRNGSHRAAMIRYLLIPAQAYDTAQRVSAIEHLDRAGRRRDLADHCRRERACRLEPCDKLVPALWGYRNQQATRGLSVGQQELVDLAKGRGPAQERLDRRQVAPAATGDQAASGEGARPLDQ